MTAEEFEIQYSVTPSPFFRGSAKPYVRWWWLAGPFAHEDIVRQLRWVRDMGFGGVEIAWIYPGWFDDDPGLRPQWLSPEWSELVTFAKRTADELGLGCDFTFGSCWPFGGSWIEGYDTAQTFNGASDQRLECSWEQDQWDSTPVLNHLSEAALKRYAQPLLKALQPALEGSQSTLFCDSLELRTEAMWSPKLWSRFEQRFGYSLEPFAASLDENPHVRYHYRRLIADTIRQEFYQPFVDLCQNNNTYARVQCHGAPTDLLETYAAVHVPESEALLFPPAFSRIAASAAAWAGRPIISAEAFTSIYGFPGRDETAETYWRQEDLADLKLLADSLFANGVNQIVWHGMPYQPAGSALEFYASVHVGPDSEWVEELPAFNKYLEEVSRVMRLGRPFAGLGVYLPFEDALMKDQLPKEERTPGANHYWEMRHAEMPLETQSFGPIWISEAFLREATVKQGLVCSRELVLQGLYVDAEWLDSEVLKQLVRLAEHGGRIMFNPRSQQPGYENVEEDYRTEMARLVLLTRETHWDDFEGLVSGINLPTYFARMVEEDLLLFFAHPHTALLKYPLDHGFGAAALREERDVSIRGKSGQVSHKLVFEPCESLALLLDSQGSITRIDLPNFCAIRAEIRQPDGETTRGKSRAPE